MKKIAVIVFAVCAFVLPSTLGFLLFTHMTRTFDARLETLAALRASVQPAPQVQPIVAVPERTTTTWVAVQEHVKNTVVQVVSEVSRFNWLQPYKSPTQEMGRGSGFFINEQGHIVTNYHVVDQARKIDIRLPWLGQEVFEVEVIGASPDRDIALCKLTEEAHERLLKRLKGSIPFLTLGDSDSVLRAQDIMALGFPLGQPNLKSTIGNVSGRERIANQYYIQMTAPINPGNSGGPSVNAAGQVIGVNFAIVAAAQNVGYVIPINDVKSALKDLYKVRLLRKPTLGCVFMPSTHEMVEYFGNPKQGGWYIARVFEGTMLDRVGVKSGDMLYELNGHQVDMFGDTYVSWSTDKVSLMDLLNRVVVGDQIDLVLYRKGQRTEISFKIEPSYLLPIRKMYPEFETIEYEVIGGMCIMQMTLNHVAALMEKMPPLAPMLAPFARQTGQDEKILVVTNIFPDSPARKARGIHAGMLIEKINGVPVETMDEFRTAVARSKSTGFLTITGRDENRFGVLTVKDVLDEDPRLASIYFYKPSTLLNLLR